MPETRQESDLAGGSSPLLQPCESSDHAARSVSHRVSEFIHQTCKLNFDRLTRLASRVLNTPICLISIVDANSQFFQISLGFPRTWATTRQTPLTQSFCRQVVVTGSVVAVNDARCDPRFVRDRAIADLGVVAYLGVPLRTDAGHVVGAFCVVDGKAREWTDRERDILADLALSVMTEVSLREEIAERHRVEETLRELNAALKSQGKALEEANARLAMVAVTDALTGLKNRRYFNERLESAHSLAARKKAPLSLVLADVDGFKIYNDTYGHPAGDEVLRGVAEVLQGVMRTSDLVARYGGEEFAVLLPETDAGGASVAAERLRRAIELRPWPLCPVTASFGAATLSTGGGCPADLVEKADRALYRSKRSGRNRVTHDRDMFED